ncbi:Mkk2p [Rhizophagus irregularis DAOM 197198w]|uniref:Mkk2p n=2 Tax=Rhizophagus irregularis TaxID=588596 RepID=A0A015KNM3_RHIIW|nr:Mkk2p [Rhizophagus irregularis DAOM 197198w]
MSSQNDDILDDSIKCENCGEIYTNLFCDWCKPCQINNLKKNFANWTSENEQIDDRIQEMQLNINTWYDIITEWIPYNKFNDIKKINENGFATLYSAIWENGRLHYDTFKKGYKRNHNENVILKCLNNSQNNINDFLNEVNTYRYYIRENTIYGISQNPVTKYYTIVLQIREKCCEFCEIRKIKSLNFAKWTSGNKEIDDYIQEMQLRIERYSDIIIEWIPYNQFNNIYEIGKGGFATVYSAIWHDGPLLYDKNEKGCMEKIKAYSILGPRNSNGILKAYGMSQNPKKKDFIIVLEYANGGNINNYDGNIIKNYYWSRKLEALSVIIMGLKNIHENKMVHRDFHTGNILLSINYGYENEGNSVTDIYISDLGLCGEANNIDKTKIYGVMPFVAPEVLKGKPYTQAADIYSLGMIMYYVATGRQPFRNCAHDNILALNICNGIRPEINEQEIPKFYIDLMKKCWDTNPNNRPSVTEILDLFENCKNDDIKKQIEEAEEFRKANLLSIENNQSTTHLKAYYTSRLLNPFTKDLPKYDNVGTSNSVEIIDFTEGKSK